MKDTRLDLYDPVRFIRTHMLDKLHFTHKQEAIAVHVTCSTQHMGESQALIELARLSSQNVVIPEGCLLYTSDAADE
ncbi:hypothetical protein QN390_25300, partial [Pseudomonas sp. RTB2]